MKPSHFSFLLMALSAFSMCGLKRNTKTGIVLIYFDDDAPGFYIRINLFHVNIIKKSARLIS